MGNLSNHLLATETGCPREAWYLFLSGALVLLLGIFGELRIRFSAKFQRLVWPMDLYPLSWVTEKNNIFFCFSKAYPCLLPPQNRNSIPSLMPEEVYILQLPFSALQRPPRKRITKSAVCLEWREEKISREHKCYLIFKLNIARKMILKNEKFV